jgi:predicted ATPase
MPDTTERAKQELKLQVMLGQSMMASKGYASPEVEQAFVRARDLSLQLDDRAQLFRAQFSLAIVYIVRAEYRRALEHAEQCLNQAEDLKNPVMLMQSHWLQGLSHCYLGEFEAARFDFEQTIAIHDTARLDSSVSLYGAVLSRAHLARELLYLGYPDQSQSIMKAAMAKAEHFYHPIGQANTLALAAFMEAFHHRSQETAEIADLISRCSEEHGLPYYSATGMLMYGWAIAMQGQAEEGLALIREGLASHLATGTRQQHTCFLALLAEALSKSGNVSAALEVLTQGISVAKQNNEPYYEAELYRLKGEALLRGSPEEGEACLRQAIETAQHQQAKSMELRAAISLARLWQEQGKIVDARQMLAEIYRWFTEGFVTPDLRDAAALLEQLQQ